MIRHAHGYCTRRIGLQRRQSSHQDVLCDLRDRGLIADCTSEEKVAAAVQRRSRFYAGFDPTADSLHLGNFVVLSVMRRLQIAGLQPVCLVGGATALIGDPSGRQSERNALPRSIVESNAKRITEVIHTVLAPKGSMPEPIIVNNQDWYSKMTTIDFLRDVGMHFRVPTMLSRDSVQSRMKNAGEGTNAGISFTEFSYQTLQAHDFRHLFEKHKVELQIGGSDQWGNIVGGIDLIHRTSGREASVSGITVPLLLASTGEKLGKSAGNTHVWLSKEKTSAYSLYQYLLNIKDDDVFNLLRKLTLVDLDKINTIEQKHKKEPHRRHGQHELATSLTSFIHGSGATHLCQLASKLLFGDQCSLHDVIDDLVQNEHSTQDLGKTAGVPVFDLTWNQMQSLIVPDLLVQCKMAKSRAEARRVLQSGGVYINGERVQVESTKEVLPSDRPIAILRFGKKRHALLRIMNE